MKAVNALFDAVLSHPDDLQVRHVLADALQDVGDPRGEFIALQLGRNHTGEKASRREKELLAAHLDTWLGRFKGAVHQPRFERGFLHHAQVQGALPSGSEKWPEWATVGSLDCRTLDLSLETRVLGSPMLTSLREVAGVSVAGLGLITRARGALPWRRLSLQVQFNLAALLKCPLPSLTSLKLFDSLVVSDFASLIRSSLGRQLAELELRLSTPGDLREVLSVTMSSSLPKLTCLSTGGQLVFEAATRTLTGSAVAIGLHQVETLELSGLKVIAL